MPFFSLLCFYINTGKYHHELINHSLQSYQLVCPVNFIWICQFNRDIICKIYTNDNFHKLYFKSCFNDINYPFISNVIGIFNLLKMRCFIKCWFDWYLYVLRFLYVRCIWPSAVLCTRDQALSSYTVTHPPNNTKWGKLTFHWYVYPSVFT